MPFISLLSPSISLYFITVFSSSSRFCAHLSSLISTAAVTLVGPVSPSLSCSSFCRLVPHPSNSGDLGSPGSPVLPQGFLEQQECANGEGPLTQTPFHPCLGPGPLFQHSGQRPARSLSHPWSRPTPTPTEPLKLPPCLIAQHF